jgi:hypothetical protein
MRSSSSRLKSPSRTTGARTKSWALQKSFSLPSAAGELTGILIIAGRSNKPTLVTRFEKASEEWATATYFNVRTGKPCRINAGEPSSKGAIAVRSYRSVLNAYVNNAESKFNGPDGKQCCSWTRGILQRMHITAGEHRYCGKELRRKLEQGPVDHEPEFKCKVYENGRVVAAVRLSACWTAFPSVRLGKEPEYIATRFG